MNPTFLSIVVPAHNEDARIAQTILEVVSELDRLGVDAELIVVDDGSTDRTASIVAAAVKDRRVRLVRTAHTGKGAAVRRGMMEARGAWRFLADADLSMPIAELRHFLAAANPVSAEGVSAPSRAHQTPVDLVLGSREAAGARRIGEPWRRHAIGRVFNWLVKLLVLRGVDDTQCGFKLFSARAADALFPLQRLDGFGFDVEILFLARRAGFAIREIPVTWKYGRASKVNVASGARGFLDLLTIRWNHLRGAYPRRVRTRERLGSSESPL